MPAYADYATACRQAGLAVHSVLPVRDGDFDFSPEAVEAALDAPALVILGSPGNPAGRVFPARAVRDLAARHPESFFLADEAFADFVEGFASLAGDRPANVAVLLSLTKAFAIPGLRLGLLATAPGLVARLRRALPPWSVNTLAQAVGVRALADTDYLRQTRAALPALRERLARGLSRLELTVTPGQANFLLAKLPAKAPGSTALCHRLLAEHGVALRDCANFPGLSDRYLRIAVRPEPETDRILFALAAILAPSAAPAYLPKRVTPALMRERSRLFPCLQLSRQQAGMVILVLCCVLLAAANLQAQTDPLPSWNDGPAKKAILAFVQATTDPANPHYVPPEARIAAFDQDGTTWVEQPMTSNCCTPPWVRISRSLAARRSPISSEKISPAVSPRALWMETPRKAAKARLMLT